MSRKKNTIFEWWICSKLPAQHIYIKPQDLPHGSLEITTKEIIAPILGRYGDIACPYVNIDPVYN